MTDIVLIQDIWSGAKRTCLILVSILGPLVSGVIYGQGDNLAAGQNFKAYVQTGANYTDNFYYSRTPGRGVAGLQLQSDLSYAYSLPRFRFEAAGGFQAAGFNIANGDDNYVDGHVNLSADWQSAERHSFAYLASAIFGHDPYGTERTAGGTLINSPLDEWRFLSTGGRYYYGTLLDPINVELRLNAISKQYTSNTAVTQFIDYTTIVAGGTLFYNYSSKTALLLDLSGNRTNYYLSPALDSTEFRILTGVRWAATAKTSGDIRVGYFKHTPRNTTSSGFMEVASVDWQVNAKWAPLPTRYFTFKAGRSTVPSYLSTVSFINSNEASASWREDWTSNLSSKLSLGYAIQEFRQSTRRDNGFSSDLATEYKLAESALLINNFGYSFRHSNSTAVEYNRFATYVGVRVLF